MTQEIELTQGKLAIVDDADFDKLNQYKWHACKNRNTFYAHRNVSLGGGEQSIVKMHRQILDLECHDGKQVDHKNRNGIDNRRSNLRIASKAVNGQNHIDLYSNNRSGRCGVSWRKPSQTWHAHIGTNNKYIYLGDFKDIKDAIEARRQGEIKYWGENSTQMGLL